MSDWRTIERFPFYEINARGEIRARVRAGNKPAGTLMRISLDENRRHVVRLLSGARARIVGVANLLVHAFKSPPTTAKAKVRFIDGDPNNIALENMEWYSAPRPTGPTRICMRCRQPFPKTHLHVCPTCTVLNAGIHEAFA